MKYFAEYLPRIGKCTLILETDDDFPTKAIVEGTSVAIGPRRLHLPANVPTTTVQVQTKETSIRFPAAKNLQLQDQPVPLGLLELASHQALTCRICQKVIVQTSDIKWKELPSEHWAELMDMWHCHKPHGPGHDHVPLVDPKFEAEPGKGWVGDTYILVDEKDCHPCPHHVPPKLWKWDLVSSKHPTRPEAYFAAMFRELVDSHATYTLSMGDLAVWVLGLDSFYTMTSSVAAERGLKVLWTTQWELRKTRPEIEEVPMADLGRELLLSTLMKSTASLPGSVASSNDWNVAFLSFS